MRRFSIRSVMAFVLVAAICLAALRNANELWAGLMITVAYGAVATALIGALILPDKERYAWAGFAVFSGGYFIISLGPGLDDAFKPYLGTTILLNRDVPILNPCTIRQCRGLQRDATIGWQKPTTILEAG
jgi:hypothetical protein